MLAMLSTINRKLGNGQTIMELNEKIELLEDANTKLLIILGYSIGLLGTLHLSLSQDKKYQWIKDATDAIAYHKGQWPVMP